MIQKLLTFLSIVLFGINYFSFDKTCIFKESILNYSSMIDPEECYSAGRAFGDVGIFPNRQYKGEGIKIGIIDDGIPSNLSSYIVGGVHGYTYGPHCESVASVLAGVAGVASEATVFFASKSDYGFNNCLSWLVNDESVDIICHSGATDTDYGYYNSVSSYYIDSIIKD